MLELGKMKDCICKDCAFPATGQLSHSVLRQQVRIAIFLNQNETSAATSVHQNYVAKWASGPIVARREGKRISPCPTPSVTIPKKQ